MVSGTRFIQAGRQSGAGCPDPQPEGLRISRRRRVFAGRHSTGSQCVAELRPQAPRRVAADPVEPVPRVVELGLVIRCQPVLYHVNNQGCNTNLINQ